jgi:hypothetical protein
VKQTILKISLLGKIVFFLSNAAKPKAFQSMQKPKKLMSYDMKYLTHKKDKNGRFKMVSMHSLVSIQFATMSGMVLE